MKIIINRTTFIAGKLAEASPKPVLVDADEARKLIAMGKAAAYVAPTPERKG